MTLGVLVSKRQLIRAYLPWERQRAREDAKTLMTRMGAGLLVLLLAAMLATDRFCRVLCDFHGDCVSRSPVTSKSKVPSGAPGPSTFSHVPPRSRAQSLPASCSESHGLVRIMLDHVRRPYLRAMASAPALAAALAM
jgi:hypothetical protein